VLWCKENWIYINMVCEENCTVEKQQAIVLQNVSVFKPSPLPLWDLKCSMVYISWSTTNKYSKLGRPYA